MRFKDPYKLFPKKLSSGRKIYYYTTYDELGRRRQFSTGKSKKTEANLYCLELLKAENLLQNKNIRFSEYAKDFYDYDKCYYIQSRLLHGYSYSRSVADKKKSCLINKIIPYFGKYYMNQISLVHIEDWLLKQKKSGISNATVNIYLSTLRVIFNEAYKRKDIRTNPMSSIKPLSEDRKKKDVLSNTEVINLFDKTTRHRIWEREVHYLINIVAAQTGMRIGEIQALKYENIHKDHIEVKHSWDRTYGIKGTKTGKNRLVPIQESLYNALKSFFIAQESTGPYIFSTTAGEQPIDHKTIYKWFYRALAAIGIEDKARRERNITFHSWRHYANTQLSAKGVPESVIQAIIGHSDGKMTKHYTSFTLADLKEAIHA